MINAVKRWMQAQGIFLQCSKLSFVYLKMTYAYIYIYNYINNIYIYIYICMKYKDLTAMSLESWLIRESIPK